MKSFFGEFREFILRRNMADLAVGVVLGGALATVTNSFVVNIVTPPLGLLFGNVNFADLAIQLGGAVKISYGLFLQAVINFTIVLLGLFLFMRLLTRLEKIALRKEQEEAAQASAPTDSAELLVLKEIRDSLRGTSSGQEINS
jgi:large conductance mechanosensitive channel